MVVAVTSRWVGNSGTTSQTDLDSASITPSANSDLYVGAWVTEDSSFVTDFLIGGGSLSWSELLSVDSGSGSFSGSFSLWRAPIGGSPGSLTVNEDPDDGGNNVGWLGMAIFDVTGLDAVTKETQLENNFADSAASVTISGLATPTDHQVAIWMADNDGTAWDTVNETGWSSIDSAISGSQYAAIDLWESSSGTLTSLTHGRNGGDYDIGVVYIEFNAAAAGGGGLVLPQQDPYRGLSPRH